MKTLLERFKAAIEEKGCFDHHKCGLCGQMVKFICLDGRLYFDSNCDCGLPWHKPEPWDWGDWEDDYLDPARGWLPTIEAFIAEYEAANGK